MTSPVLKKSDWIAGLEKGLAILEAFDDQHPRMTPTQAAKRTGMTRTAARRYLLTLAHLGYTYTDGKMFGLTPRVLRAGWAYFDSARLPRLVQPYLQQLSMTINESVYVSVLDEWELVFIARNSAARLMTTGFVLGARVPAPLASPGLVLLAYQHSDAEVAARLEDSPLVPLTPFTVISNDKLKQKIQQVHADGYAVMEQQLQLGVRGLAVPLRNRRGEVVAALSTNMPMGNETAEAAIARVLNPLRETALAMLNAL